jgi:hypothetical protein
MKFSLLLLSTGLLAACYNPDLGESPFRCGTDDPKCPEGYTCHVYSPSEQICEQGNVGPDGGGGSDGGDLSCNDDSSIEPNDTTGNAWVTPIPSTMPSVSLVQLAICPTTDRDLFRFGVEVNGKNMKATITTDVADGPLLLQVLNGAGATIANGQAVSQTEIVVAVNNLAIGSYYVQVAANGADVENNYTIDIVTCDGAPCP